MTPLEKALELRDKYFELLDEDDFHIRYMVAEKCALVTVEEILSLGYKSKSDFKLYDFYSKVKIEINKL